jgi:hypothetical protein
LRLIAPLNSAAAIAEVLPRFLDEIRRDSWRRPPPAVVARYSRARQTELLAALLQRAAARKDQPAA